MAKVSMSLDTEQAVKIILSVSSILNDKRISIEESPTVTAYGNGGFGVLEDALLMAAKAIDVDNFGGVLTESVIFIEGSAE